MSAKEPKLTQYDFVTILSELGCHDIRYLDFSDETRGTFDDDRAHITVSIWQDVDSAAQWRVYGHDSARRLEGLEMTGVFDELKDGLVVIRVAVTELASRTLAAPSARTKPSE